MAAYAPFTPITSSLNGKTATFTVESTSVSVVMSLTVYAPTMLVTAAGPTGVTLHVRMYPQVAATVSVTAGIGDIPMVCGGPPMLFMTPTNNTNSNLTGNVVVAAICSLTTSPVNVYFTPGQGGA